MNAAKLCMLSIAALPVTSPCFEVQMVTFPQCLRYSVVDLPGHDPCLKMICEPMSWPKARHLITATQDSMRTALEAPGAVVIGDPDTLR